MFWIALAAAVLAANGNKDDQEEQRLVVISASWVTPIAVALNDFKKGHKNYACYDIEITPRSDVLTIGFTSDLTVKTTPGSDVVVLTPPMKCGRGRTYWVRLNGQIVRKTRG